jgi:DNA-binding MarR family transcriptional regulator
LPADEDEIEKCVIETLSRAKTMRALELRRTVAHRMGVSEPVANRAVQAMIKDEKIQRGNDPDDGRKRIYYLPENKDHYLKTIRKFSTLDGIVLSEAKKFISEALAIPTNSNHSLAIHREHNLKEAGYRLYLVIKELEKERENKFGRFETQGDAVQVFDYITYFSRVIRMIESEID